MEILKPLMVIQKNICCQQDIEMEILWPLVKIERNLRSAKA